MIASLPMYDWPETKAAHDQFWTRLYSRLKPVCDAVPSLLDRADLYAQWQREDVILSQTCIYPLVTRLPASTVVVGTPNYAVDGCDDGQYASVLLARRSDTRKDLAAFDGARLAYNSKDSQSGFNSLKSLLTDKQLINTAKSVFFSKAIQTGSHRASIASVAAGITDICAIDPVSWALAQRYDDDAKQLHVLSSTAYVPSLPLITSAAAIPSAINESEWRTVVMEAFVNAIDNALEKELLLGGITYIPKAEYMKLPISNLDMITL